MLESVNKDPTDLARDGMLGRQDQSGDLTPRRPADDFPRVYWLNRDTVAIDWFGEVTEEMCRYALAQLQQLTSERRPRYFFSDTSASTGYIPTIRRGAADILMHLRRVGILEMAAVFSSPSIRMFAAAVAFVCGLKLRAFESREDALRAINSRYRWDN